MNDSDPAANRPSRDEPSRGRAEMLFIVGRARSGSTLLQLMLDAHSQISAPPECQFIMNLHNKYRKGLPDMGGAERFVADVWLEERISTWEIEPATLRRRISDCAFPARFSDLCAEVYREYAESHGKQGAKYFCDNNHHYSLFVSGLAKAFPNAKFIHLIRDYRGNVLSHQNVAFESNSAAVLAHRWRIYHRAVRHDAALLAGRMIQVRYEDLVAEPRDEMRRICRFLGVRFEEPMLRHYEAKRPEYRDPWQTILDKPANTSRINAWQHDLADADIVLCEAICDEEGAHYDYRLFANQPQSVTKRARVLAGGGYAALLTFVERLAFNLPLRIRSAGIAVYRRLNRTIGQHDSSSKRKPSAKR